MIHDCYYYCYYVIIGLLFTLSYIILFIICDRKKLMEQGTPIETNNDPLTPAQIEQLIAQRVADAVAQNDADHAARATQRDKEGQGNPLT